MLLKWSKFVFGARLRLEIGLKCFVAIKFLTVFLVFLVLYYITCCLITTMQFSERIGRSVQSGHMTTGSILFKSPLLLPQNLGVNL